MSAKSLFSFKWPKHCNLRCFLQKQAHPRTPRTPPLFQKRVFEAIWLEALFEKHPPSNTSNGLGNSKGLSGRGRCSRFGARNGPGHQKATIVEGLAINQQEYARCGFVNLTETPAYAHASLLPLPLPTPFADPLNRGYGGIH